MGQLSKFLRKTERGYIHWCDGCQDSHEIFETWHFNGHVKQPSFNYSVKIEGKKTIKVDGKWTGEWVLDDQGEPIDYCCHYSLKDGILNYLGDCTHVLAGTEVPLSELPWFLKDE